MAHIRKRDNGSFQATVYAGKTVAGKKIYEYITCDSLKECKTKARELERDIENKTYSNLGKVNFDVWCEKWASVSFGELAPSTQKSYKMYVNFHFVPFFGSLKLEKITEMHIKEYVSDKLKKLSPTTVRKHFFVLSWILKDALKSKNPCVDIVAPQAKKYKPEILQEDGFVLIHAALKGTWDEIPLLMAAFCGMREGEIFALKWDDILKSEGLIRVDENRAIGENGYMDKAPKSDRGMREIAAPDVVFKLIEDYRMNLESISNYLFTMRPDSYSERFGKLINRHNKAIKLIKSGKKTKDEYVLVGNKRKIQFNPQSKPLPDVRFHDLRHYHATVLHKHGISDQYAAARLGHDVMVLKKIYQHLETGVKKNIDEKVKELFR